MKMFWRVFSTTLLVQRLLRHKSSSGSSVDLMTLMQLHTSKVNTSPFERCCLKIHPGFFTEEHPEVSPKKTPKDMS